MVSTFSMFCFLAAFNGVIPENREKICYTSFDSVHKYKDVKDFHDWRMKYNKTYEGERNYNTYFDNWKSNREFVRLHNIWSDKFKLEINHFGDVKWSSWVHRPSFNIHLAEKKFIEPKEEPLDLSLPASIDWRTKGVVTEVKNQGQCGSCWAFSAVGSMEGQHALSTGNLVSLSESQIVDCDSNDSGCGGGFMPDAYEYVIQNKGIESEKKYPYKPEDDPCNFNKTDVVATFKNYKDVTGGENGLKKAVAMVGPISVGIDASAASFGFYKDGVYYDPSCSTTELDHGVLVVGYGTTVNGTDYWIVKNSWGNTWGKDGYIWMARNRDNNCGIATSPSYPIV